MTFQGMDVAQVREHAERVRLGQERLVGELDRLDAEIGRSTSCWRGPDAEGFRATWASIRAAAAERALDGLARDAASLHEHADDQEHASAAHGTDSGGGSSGTGTTDDDATGDGSIADPVADPGGSDLGYLEWDVAIAWQNMSKEERERVAQAIVDAEFERYGMEPIDISFESSDYMGSWREDFLFFGGKLTINSDLLSDPAILHALVHEVRHAAQFEFIEQTDRSMWDVVRGDDKSEEYEQIEEDHGITREEIEAWRTNFSYGNRTPAPVLPDDPTPEESAQYRQEYEEYFEQPTEVDARASGREWVNDLTFEDLQDYQREAGVPVSERAN